MAKAKARKSTRKKTSKGVRGESESGRNRRIRELERFLGIPRDDFSRADRSYFNWWFDSPRLVDVEPLKMEDLRKKYNIATEKRF